MRNFYRFFFFILLLNLLFPDLNFIHFVLGGSDFILDGGGFILGGVSILGVVVGDGGCFLSGGE